MICLRNKTIPLSLFSLLLLSGCTEKEDKYVERSVGELYNTAMDKFNNNEYVSAAKAFDEVERQHPYSQWATKAQLMAAYSYYKNAKYEQALEEVETFIQLHPNHKNIAYAYYLQALCHYAQIPTVELEQTETRKALSSLQEILRRFPNSSYAKDARYKIILAQDHLAGKEMTIGRFYLKKKLYIAATRRFKSVIENYQTTNHIPEALHRLVECYIALGINEEAQSIGAVLGHNFPGNQWYQDSYSLLTQRNLKPVKKEGSWISQTWKRLFK